MHQKTVFDNGVRVVSEHIPHARTVCVGIWVDVGARDEHDLTNGCSHFVEHMLFKGTPSRSASQIAMELDVLGGMSNAFTSKDATCYYGMVLDSQLPRLVDLLADFFLNSLFADEEIERERQVILQEISMVEDTPEEQVHELFEGLLWGHHPLGNTILGPLEVVSRMDRQKLLEHVKTFYTPDRLVFAAAGNVQHQEFCELLAASFASLKRRAGSGYRRREPQEMPLVRRVYTKHLEQVHVTMGTYAMSVTSEERYKLMLLNILLGGNMSSRLFQEIREKRGLAYSVHSYVDAYADSGYLGIYLGVNAENVNQSLAVIRDELDKLSHGPVTAAELANAKDYATTGIFLAADNLELRMTRIARNELYFGRNVDFDEVVAGLTRVTAPELQQLAASLFARGMTSAVLGPVADKDVQWRQLDARAAS
ncbi:MAG: pitrilysin family protein [Thermodesulfobacteriota bacterium]